ncbi:MAG: TIM barrel protein, partial [Clostridia bacterium]
MEYGVQTYTLRMYMQTEKDIAHSLKAIADMGYRNVQISGIGSITPFKLRALCDERNLRIVLTHSPEARIIADTEALIAEHKILGCRYIGLGAMSEKYRSEAWIDRFAADFTTPAQKIADAGMRFMYHQHNFEFERLANGQTLMERLLEQMPTELMGVTADTYWLQAGG